MAQDNVMYLKILNFSKFESLTVQRLLDNLNSLN